MTEENKFDLATCTHLVTQYLLAQEWQLVDPNELATTIYQDLVEDGFGGSSVIEAVQTRVWQHYAKLVHDCCRQADEEKKTRAWTELRRWLGQQVHRLPARPEEHEDVIQEALADLQTFLAKNELEAPQAFLMYALQALRRKAIDMNRKRVAVSRGGDQNPLSWEEMNEEFPEKDVKAASVRKIERKVENVVSNAELRAKLKAFFQRHLSSDQQLLVAKLYFLDGLEPKEIAGLLGKRSHPIRMVKARIVQTLRALPPDRKEILLEILDEIDREDSHDS